MSNTTKTVAKRMGVKSVLSYGNQNAGDRNLAITTFGKGNRANIELDIAEDSLDTLDMPFQAESFLVRNISRDIDLKRGELEVLLDNPAEGITDDYLGLKSTLEREVFGREFPGDNIRIQIIHNILDIQKIFGLNITDIIYTINNLQDDHSLPDREVTDIVGLSLNNNQNAEQILNRVSAYMGFFGDAFKLPSKKSKWKTNGSQDGGSQPSQNNQDDNNLGVLRILATTRHMLVHFDEDDKRKDPRVIFNTQDALPNLYKKNKCNWSIIANGYKKRIDDVNWGFRANSGMNLNILFEVLNANTIQEKQKIIDDYYRFAIRKEGKNLGVSMKKLREIMIETYHPKLKDKKFDSYRSKLYAVTDYVLFRHFRNSEALDTMVSSLRESADEDTREKLYEELAKTAWNQLNTILLPFFKKFAKRFVKYESVVKGLDVSPDVILRSSGNTPVQTGNNQNAKKPNCNRADDMDTPDPFVQLLAFLCNFLEGKEINEFLSAYMNKFENIQSFIDTLSELKHCPPVRFSDNYGMFNDCGGHRAGRIASQLRILLSIGKMKPDLNGAKRPLYQAAIAMLGIDGSEEWVSDQWLENNVLVSSKNASSDMKKAVNPFRNFIANNVISSRRFLFLVRYTKPWAVRALMNNKTIISYVLGRLPETQVESYYRSFFCLDTRVAPPKPEVMIADLTEKLAGLSFRDLVDRRGEIIDNSKLSTSRKLTDVEQLKRLIGLYLTVAYVAIKNLVKTNARYLIAFFAFERDLSMFLTRENNEHGNKDALTCHYLPYEDSNGKKIMCKLFALTEYFLQLESDKDYRPAEGEPFDMAAYRLHRNSVRRHLKKKWRDIFRQTIESAREINHTGLLLKMVRNNAAHLNVLHIALPKYIGDFSCGAKEGSSVSYFMMYHYLMQRLLLQTTELKLDPRYRKWSENYGLPCSDLIKIAYITLGYNLPRYKNLTIDGLFDKDNRTGDEKASKGKS